MTQKREIGRRIVERRVLGSANPVARWGRDSKQTCFDSIGGFFVGLLLFFVPFWLAYSAATQEKDSKDVRALKPVAASSAAGIEGKALLQGQVQAASLVKPLVASAEGIIAYHYLKEKYEMHIETRRETKTRIEGGQEVQYTEEVTEEVWEWEPKDEVTQYADTTIGGFRVDMQAALLDLPWETIHSKEWTDAEGAKWREKEEVIRGGFEGLYAAEFAGGSIAPEPDFHILTNRNQDELVAHLHSLEEGMRWGKLIIAVILMMVSLNLMIGPAMILINIIPVKEIGCGLRAIIGLISLVFSVAIVGFTYSFVRYWWVVILLLVGLVVWVVIDAGKRRGRGGPEDPLGQAAA